MYTYIHTSERGSPCSKQQGKPAIQEGGGCGWGGWPRRTYWDVENWDEPEAGGGYALFPGK